MSWSFTAASLVNSVEAASPAAAPGSVPGAGPPGRGGIWTRVLTVTKITTIKAAFAELGSVTRPERLEVSLSLSYDIYNSLLSNKA
eukprot:764899-Hanusia_phi.AAC.7